MHVKPFSYRVVRLVIYKLNSEVVNLNQPLLQYASEFKFYQKVFLTFDRFSLCIFETCSALSYSKEVIMLSLASFSSSSRLLLAILISCSCFSLKSISEAYKLISTLIKAKLLSSCAVKQKTNIQLRLLFLS